MEKVKKISLDHLKEEIVTVLKKLNVDTWFFGEAGFGHYFLFEKPRDWPDSPHLDEETEELYNNQINLLAEELINKGLEPYFHISDIMLQPALVLVPSGFSSNELLNVRHMTEMRTKGIQGAKKEKKRIKELLKVLNAKFKEVKTWKEFEKFQGEIRQECLVIRSKKGNFKVDSFTLLDGYNKERVHYLYFDSDRTGTSYVDNLYKYMEITYN